MDLVGPLALVVGPSATWNWYADPARSGASLTGRVSLRYRPIRWLTVRLGYAHTLRTASDPVYGFNVDRLFTEIEFRLARTTWVSAAAFGETGDGTFYREILAGTEVSPSVTTFEPYRAPSSTVGVGIGLEQGLGAGFSVDLGATLRRTTTPDGAQTGPAFSASVVWRWD